MMGCRRVMLKKIGVGRKSVSCKTPPPNIDLSFGYSLFLSVVGAVSGRLFFLHFFSPRAVFFVVKIIAEVIYIVYR